jgi:hypothetical protein
MKNLQFFAVVILLFFISCNGTQDRNAKNEVQSFIEGTYVRTFEGEYSKGNDTLIIDQPDNNNNYYTIKHNSSYQKIRSNQLLPAEHKTENWTAIFNEQTNVLEEQKYGKMISFLPDEDALLLGNSKFKKIK